MKNANIIKCLIFTLMLLGIQVNMYSQSSSVQKAFKFLDSMLNLYHHRFFIYDDYSIEHAPHFEGNHKDILLSQNDTNSKYGKYCGKIIFKHKDTLYGNVRYTRGADNFGNFRGSDLTGADSIKFWLKGSGLVEIAIGGTNNRPFNNLKGNNFPYSDGMDVRGTGLFNLTSDWKQYGLKIKGDTTFYVYKSAYQGVNNRYPQIVYLQDDYSCNNYLTVDPNGKDEKGDSCMKASWTKPTGANCWAGRMMFPPEKTWDSLEQGYDLSGITAIRLKIKSSKVNTGLRLVFGTENDSSKDTITQITVDTVFKEYVWKLDTNLNYKNIVGGMGFAVSNVDINTPDSVDIYFDSIRYDGVYLKTDLSNVITGISIIAPADLNKDSVVVFFDDIYYNNARLNDKRLARSFVIPKSSNDPSQSIAAHVYDNVLTALAYLMKYYDSKDTMAVIKASYIAEALIYAMNNDRKFKDHRLRNAYSIGTIESHLGKAKLPGWWSVDSMSWFEDRYFNGTTVGNMSWAGIMFLTLHDITNQAKYLTASQQLADWIIDSTKTKIGFSGGFEGHDTIMDKLPYLATEHNIDAYVLFKRLYAKNNSQKYKDAYELAASFVFSMRDPRGYFYTGTDNTGVNPNKLNFVLDIHPWYVLASESYQNSDTSNLAMKKAIDSCYLPSYKSRNYNQLLNGFDFNGDKDGIWLEGSMQMATALNLMGRKDETKILCDMAEYVQVNGINNDGKGLPAADHDSLGTGFNWIYNNWLHLAPTAWFIFTKLSANPYYCIPGISTALINVINNRLKVLTFPNPFKDKLNVSYELDETSKVKISIYDGLGKKIKSTVNSNQGQGRHLFVWDTQNDHLSEGLYFLLIYINERHVITKKIIFYKS